MKVTLLVSMDVDPTEDLASLSSRVSNRLSNEFAVIAVKPWSRPKTAPTAKAKAVMTAFRSLPR
jgi:hypothetical protein